MIVADTVSRLVHVMIVARTVSRLVHVMIIQTAEEPRNLRNHAVAATRAEPSKNEMRDSHTNAVSRLQSHSFYGERVSYPVAWETFSSFPETQKPDLMFLVAKLVFQHPPHVAQGVHRSRQEQTFQYVANLTLF